MKQSLSTMLLALGLCACQAPVAAPPVPPPSLPAPDAAARLLAQIRAEIGDAPCSRDAQCRTLPIGAKACGGPAAWWAWSEVNASGDRLQRWAQELERIERERQAREGLLSNCVVVPDPGASCVAQRCVPNARGAAR